MVVIGRDAAGHVGGRIAAGSGRVFAAAVADGDDAARQQRKRGVERKLSTRRQRGRFEYRAISHCTLLCSAAWPPMIPQPLEQCNSYRAIFARFSWPQP